MAGRMAGSIAYATSQHQAIHGEETMAKDTHESLDEIYKDLKTARDEILLKLHLGGMELRNEWEEVEREWENWTAQLSKDLEAKSEALESSLREAGGDDLRKIEIKSRLAVTKMKRGFEEIEQKLSEK